MSSTSQKISISEMPSIRNSEPRDVSRYLEFSRSLLMAWKVPRKRTRYLGTSRAMRWLRCISLICRAHQIPFPGSFEGFNHPIFSMRGWVRIEKAYLWRMRPGPKFLDTKVVKVCFSDHGGELLCLPVVVWKVIKPEISSSAFPPKNHGFRGTNRLTK